MNDRRQWKGVGLSPDHVLKYLHAGATLITATPALAADWKHRMVLQANGVIAMPEIITWQHCVMNIASSYPDMPVPLTARQEMQLWERVIHHDLIHNNVSREKSISVWGLARHASKAWMLMQEYRINVQELIPGGEEAEALVRWIHAMQSQLGRKIFTGRMLAAEISRHLYTRLRTQGAGTALPGSMILDGFESLTPMQHQILDALQQKGCEIFHVSRSGRKAVCTLTACPDDSSELWHIAGRIKVLLAQDERMRILVLTAESGCDITRLRRTLDSVLVPDACLDPVRDTQAAATSGDVLSHWPMIEQVLHLLSLAEKQHITFDDFSPLLFFPWLSGYEDERMGRALLDAKFREQNRRRLSLNGLLKSADIQSLPLLLAVIRAVADWKPGRQSAAFWVKAVHTLLLSVRFFRTGLEDEQPRSHPEIRQMNAFREVLSSLVALDAVEPVLEWHAFLSQLRTSCAETRLGCAPLYPNVVLMPLNQVTGMQSGHVFVMGIDEEAFPFTEHPYPLLPVRLQRKYGIPMSGGAQTFASSRWLWEQLLQVAPTIECSYARQNDEREMLPSSFVAGWPETDMQPFSRQQQQSLELETFEDTPDVPLLSDETIHGGTSIIKKQSACPFRAFATHRLGIAPLGETEPGIKAAVKGSLIHLALEFIWRRLKAQAILLKLTRIKRNVLLDAAIDHAWQEKRIFRDPDVQAIEKKRMRHVLNAWLDMEATRPPFEVCEYEKLYTLDMPEAEARQFPVRIKVDRIDRDGTGRRILIDYKTGHKQPVTKWLGERMEEPQLPLYALAAGISVDDAVTFATVRSGDEMGFEGLTGENTGIAGIAICDGKYGRPEDWPQVLTDWRIRINVLAREFVAGRNTVAPRDSRACAYCGLEAVCRIEETGFEADVEEEVS